MTKIESVRKAAGMSQGELARLLGVTQGAVSQWEQGATNPTVSRLAEIARIFGVKVDDLLEATNDPLSDD